ncbi:MAG: hypothetical protein JWN92_2614 [Candidatus Acidoferrum typicum]|nr:hypothetical protein [Candidatus Acidoferrum typicum]
MKCVPICSDHLQVGMGVCLQYRLEGRRYKLATPANNQPANS